MSTLAPPTRPPAQAPASPSPRRRGRRAITLGIALVGLIILALVALFAGAGNPPCTTTTTPGPIPIGTPTGGQFAAPLQLTVGRWYQVGATQYGGPNDSTSGDYGASGTYLPNHPDSFAELSVLSTNPADTGAFTFADADALGNLPYGTPVRVAHDRHELTLAKEDIGYGQGPGQSIPYRLDIWWQAALALGVSKSTVQIQRLPASGSGALLDQLPAGSAPPAPVTTTPACTSGTGGPTPTPIVSGSVAQINPITGVASAPADAPAPVREVIAAGNQLIDKPYIWGGGHADLDQLAAGYDCSGSSEYVLHNAGLYAPTSGPDSTAMEHVYPSGPGRWITVYASPVHMWLVVAGIVLNTAWYGPSVVPSTPDSGPRWQPASTIQQQIAGNAAAGNPSFVVSHPEGL